MFKYNENVQVSKKNKKQKKNPFDYIMVKKMYGSEATGFEIRLQPLTM